MIPDMTGFLLILTLEKWDMLDVVLEFPEIETDGQDEYRNNALHYISLSGNVHYLEKMLKIPSSTPLLLMRNIEGNEPIHNCILTDSVDCFEFILNKYGRKETHEELINTKRNKKGQTSMQMAIYHQSLKIFYYCLNVTKKTESMDDKQKSILHYIIDSSNYEIFEAYLSKKPNLKIIDNNKENPLFYCLKNGKTGYFKVFLDL